jgi:hypothetical protein
VEDVRFNRPAKDGDMYTEEGIYIITVSNRYTNQRSEKRIYVGTNDVMKAHVTTGLEIGEITRQLSMGATVDVDGSLKAALPTEPTAVAETQPTAVPVVENQQPAGGVYVWGILAAVMLLGTLALVAGFVLNKKTKTTEQTKNGGVE